MTEYIKFASIPLAGTNEPWTEEEIEIGSLENMIDDHEVEIWTPDGWVRVSAFVDKGAWNGYEVVSVDRHLKLICNEGHLFKTESNEWISAKTLYEMEQPIKLMTERGATRCFINKTDGDVPIVDIQVDHENHRYYAAGFESHNTNVGKSALLAGLTADFANDGHNVLYISNEMGEIPIAERLDACILQTPINELKNLPREYFTSQIARIQKDRLGRVKLRQYPTRTAGIRHFRLLLQDLERKENFKPDIIMLDYLNNCIPTTVRQDSNSYERVKAIAEEVRGLAIEFNIPIIAPTQTNRGGQNNSDVELEDVSESHGISQTADLMFAIMRSTEMDEAGQILIKVVKNRMESRGVCTKFSVGFDFSRMTLYATSDNSFSGGNDSPVFDKSATGIRFDDENVINKWLGD